MSDLYSPAYLVDHLALRAGCPPRRVWFVLYELYWIAEEWADAVDPLTSDQAAEVERVLWEELDDALEREYAPDFTPRRPIGQRVFTPALACTIPQNFSSDFHKFPFHSYLTAECVACNPSTNCA